MARALRNSVSSGRAGGSRAPRALALACALAALVGSGSAAAEPFIAVREGYKCSRCHVNRTGGGKRTSFGDQYALTHLDAFASSPGEAPSRAASAAAGLLDPNLNDWISIGADVRFSNATVFAKETHNGFEVGEADLYLQADATKWATLYVDTSVAQGSLESREAFVLFNVLPGASVKAGYMLLPFGLRIWGDEQYVRKETGYNFASPDLGLELGFEKGPFGIFFAVSNGSGGAGDPDDYKKLSLLTEVSAGHGRVGLSGSWNRTDDRMLLMGGPYLGLALGRLSLLGEADLVTTRYVEAAATVHSLVAYAEGNLLLWRGINAKVGYGYHDPDLEIPENTRFNLRAGLEVAPVPRLIAGAYAALGRSVPQDEIGNAEQLLFELHLHF